MVALALAMGYGSVCVVLHCTSRSAVIFVYTSAKLSIWKAGCNASSDTSILPVPLLLPMFCICVCNLLMLSSQDGCCNASCESGMVLLGILFHLVNVCCWCMLTYLCAMWCSLLRLSGVILLLCKLPMLLTVMGHLGMLHLHKAHLPSSLFFSPFFLLRW